MRILVAEDLPVIAKSLCAMLRHYAVDVAGDGQVAWQLIKAYNYDLLILEENLAGIDGVELCRQARCADQQMPILLISPRNDTHRKSVGLDAGADDYMVQPIDEEELVARVRALLRRGRLTQQPVMSWGDLHLEARSRSVTYKTHLLGLTPKEYALLELLLSDSVVAHPLQERRVFSYDSIIEHLWIGDDSPGEEAVRTHVKGLRHKLKVAGAVQDPIETIYGVGYRLRPPPNSKKTPLSVLVADPDLAVTRDLQQAGKAEDIVVRVVRDRASLLLELAAAPQLLLLDALALSGNDLLAAADLLAEIRRLQPNICLLWWSQKPNLDLRQMALQHRVSRFLAKPMPQDQVLQIFRSIERRYLSPQRSLLLLGFGAEAVTVGLENYRLLQLSDPQLIWPTLQREEPLLIAIDGRNVPQAIELCWMLRADAQWADRPILLFAEAASTSGPWYVALWQPSIALAEAILPMLR
jgi:DNA-binding response OmpR family regulator